MAKFSQIENATWRYDIYPISESISPPLTAIKTGDAFRQGDLELVVKDVYIRPSDDSNRWAVRVWYELRNVGSKRIVVDIDYAYLDVMDSFSARFMDWDGGGLYSIGIDPGKNFQFDRTYSTSHHEQSRITTGAEFVLVNTSHISGFPDAQWVYIINR